MTLSRRRLLHAASTAGMAALLRPAIGRADATASKAQTEAWETPRTLGSPTAPTEVVEFFSLTCTHCARFAAESFPEIEKNLIGTGKVRWVFRDFPLDRVALQAEMIARALPPARYAPFLLAMFASQDRWAFGAADPQREIRQMALLAGMNAQTFDAAWNDTALRDWILNEQKAAQTKYAVDSTPTFLVNGQKHAGEMSYPEFAKIIPNA